MKHLPTLACLALSVVFAWAFDAHYGSASDCIAGAAADCVGSDGANLISGGAVWGVLSIGFLLAAFVCFWRSR